uniref:Protein kinase domain-containing protein n=1 Tax=Oryza meridionalis TaxID=40149 RepID=A0A0E0FAV9_9ORYZ
MADPVSSLKHITQMALKIKEAVDTVRRNKEDCLQIRRRVVRVSDILSQLQETGNIMSNPAMSAALEDLSETLRHAHTLVVSCQEKNVVCLLCAATALSKKLRRVNDDISDQMMVGIFVTTVHTTIALSQIQGDAQHDVMYALPRTEITDDIEATLPKKEEPKPPSPPREAEPEPEPPLPPPEEPTPLVRNEPSPAPTPEKPEATQVVKCHPSPERKSTYTAPQEKPEATLCHPSPKRKSTYPAPPEKPEATLVLECYPSSEEEPTPPLSPQIGEVRAEDSGFRYRTARTSSASSMASSRPISGKQKFQKRTLMKLGFSEMEIATHHFATRIGQGGSATFYKGVLRDGLEVAIRKHENAHPNRYDDKPEMHRLIHLCSMLEHKNIVKVLGYCDENRGVDFSNENTPKEVVGEQLDWSSRFQIIQGITQGIIYLHTHSGKPTIVHLDLKPDNILLDSDMNPKIGDFGLAKVLEDDEINASVRGTLGYMPPEYIVEGVISVKNDVYGFGVTLLETISGMSKSGRDTRHQASIEWAWGKRNSGVMNKLFDPSLCDNSQLKEIKRCIEIGLLCTQKKPTDRPTMPDVLQMLQGTKKVPTPKQPGYIKRVREAERYKQV